MKTAAVALIAAAMFALPASAHGPDGDASVTFAFDLNSPTGAVMVALYDSASAYDGGAPVRQAMVDVAGGQTSAVFEDLPAGDYAMKAFHDVDGDGAMDTNPFGMPTEPFAFSNNAVGNMGPASWDRARFAADGEVVQTISLK